MHLPSQAAFKLLPPAIILGLSLVCVGFWVVEPLGQPGPEDYRAAAERVAADWQPHDALAVRPWWASRLREFTGAHAVLQVRDLSAEDLSACARLWLVSLPGYAERLDGPFADGRYARDLDERVGALRLRRFRLGDPLEVLYDFRARLQQAAVRMATGGGAWKPCGNWLENRWVCSERDWNYVGRMIVELGDDPREVIWAHPSDTGPIEIRFPAVPHGRELLLHTGFTPPAARILEGAPVELLIRVDGREALQISQPNVTGWFPHTLDLSPFGSGPHEVVFVVSARHAGMRHFCFAAEVRR